MKRALIVLALAAVLAVFLAPGPHEILIWSGVETNLANDGSASARVFISSRIEIAPGFENHFAIEFAEGCFIPANNAPIADAGGDQNVLIGESVTLDGSASTDPDGDLPLTYQWSLNSKPSGSLTVIQNPTDVLASLVPDMLGDYVVQLVVTDSLGNQSTPDVIVISTTNTAPVSDAGPDQVLVQIGTVVQLDGSQSFDDDGDAISYAWTLLQKPDGSLASLSDPTIVNPTFVADVQGDYVAGLVVTDQHGASSQSDNVTISFNNVRPVADARDNQLVLLGDTVALDGSGSTDANLDPLTYQWSLTARPAGSVAALDDATLASPSFTTDLPGIYALNLVVNDGFVDSDPSNVTVSAVTLVDLAVAALQDLIAAVNNLGDADFKNARMKKALTNKLIATVDLVDQGLFDEALNKLTHDVLGKSGGCAETGAPDRNDWITNCAAQDAVTPLIYEVIDLIGH